MTVACLGAGLPPHEPELPEPRDEVAAPPALLGPGPRLVQALLEVTEGLEQQVPARGHEHREDRPLQDREGGLVGQGHADGYCQLGHGGVLSGGDSSGRYVPLPFRWGISFGTGSRATLTTTPCRSTHDEFRMYVDAPSVGGPWLPRYQKTCPPRNPTQNTT